MQNTPASLGIIFIVVSLKSAVPLLEMHILNINIDRKDLNSALLLQVLILVTLTKKLGQKDMTLDEQEEGLMKLIDTNQDMKSIYITPHIEEEVPASSSCSSSSDKESSNSDSHYTSDDCLSGSSSDDRYFSPERHCHQLYRRQSLYEKYHHDQDDTIYQQPRSLLLPETGKNKSYVDIMPEVENRDNRDFKATRKLRALDDTPVTRSSSFKQEFLHRLDNINCMAKLILSRSQTPPRTGFRNQLLNWRGCFCRPRYSPPS